MGEDQVVCVCVCASLSVCVCVCVCVCLCVPVCACVCVSHETVVTYGVLQCFVTSFLSSLAPVVCVIRDPGYEGEGEREGEKCASLSLIPPGGAK